MSRDDILTADWDDHDRDRYRLHRRPGVAGPRPDMFSTASHRAGPGISPHTRVEPALTAPTSATNIANLEIQHCTSASQ